MLHRSRPVPLTVRALATGMGWTRVAVGATALAATNPGLAAIGLASGEPGSALTAVARLVGTRDVALGAFALGARGDRGLLRTITAANAAVDALDAATFAVPLLRRQGIDRASIFSMGSALAASAMGFWLTRRLS
jgi:hypothetical protein